MVNDWIDITALGDEYRSFLNVHTDEIRVDQNPITVLEYILDKSRDVHDEDIFKDMRKYISCKTEYMSIPDEDMCQSICPDECDQEFIKAKEMHID